MNKHKGLEVIEHDSQEAWDEWQRLSQPADLDTQVERDKHAVQSMLHVRWVKQSLLLAAAVILVATCATVVLVLHKPF